MDIQWLKTELIASKRKSSMTRDLILLFDMETSYWNFLTKSFWRTQKKSKLKGICSKIISMVIIFRLLADFMSSASIWYEKCKVLVDILVIKLQRYQNKNVKNSRKNVKNDIKRTNESIDKSKHPWPVLHKFFRIKSRELQIKLKKNIFPALSLFIIAIVDFTALAFLCGDEID